MVYTSTLLKGLLAALSFGLATSTPNILEDVAQSLKHPAPQSVTNGLSKWGTWNAPRYPKFLKNNPMSNGFPWGSLTDHSDPYNAAPYTGVTRHYTFDVSRMRLAPDGVVKDMIVVNKQFPGPTIEANWGDWIEGRAAECLCLGCANAWRSRGEQ